MDSTALDDAVARQDTITQLIASIRRVGRDVPDAAVLVTAHCTRLARGDGSGLQRHRQAAEVWDHETGREELVTALVDNALALLAALDAAHHSAPHGCLGSCKAAPVAAGSEAR